MKKILEQAKRLISLQSIAQEGDDAATGYLDGLLNNLGIKTQLQHVTHSLDGISKRQFNLIGIVGDPLVDRKIRKGLLLLSHLDTHLPGDPTQWTENEGKPFDANITADRIFGLGVADSKLDFLCKLHATSRFVDQKLKQPIYLVASCGEKAGMLGSKYLLQSGALNPQLVMVGKPTGLRLAYAHKPVAVYDLSLEFQTIERGTRGFNRRLLIQSRGRSADAGFVGATHASGGQPNVSQETPQDAISRLLAFLISAQENGFELKYTFLQGGLSPHQVADRASAEFFLTSHQLEDFKRFFKESLPRLGSPQSLNLELGGIGDTGMRFLPDNLFPCLTDVYEVFQVLKKEFHGQSDAAMEVPESTVNPGVLAQDSSALRVSFEVRPSQPITAQELDQKLNQVFHQVSRRFPKMNILLKRRLWLPGLQATADQEWVRMACYALESAGLPPTTYKSAHFSEAGLFMAKGFPALVFGPGVSSGNSGSPNESVFTDEIPKVIRFYESVIERVCL